METPVAPDGCKRERDGDDHDPLSKKLRSEDIAPPAETVPASEVEVDVTGNDKDVVASETKDEEITTLGEAEKEVGGDGKKIESEVEEEDKEKRNSSNDEGDALVSEVTKKKDVKEAKVGPMVFTSSLDMLNYFHELVRTWPVNYNVNKFEFLMLEDLIKQGHQDPETKIGVGIEAFQVRMNPMYASRCYYIIRKDGSTDDFSYRRCVDNIFPLPEELKAQIGDKKHQGGGGGGQHHNNNNSKNYYRGRGGRHGGGRGGYGRGNRGGKRF